MSVVKTKILSSNETFREDLKKELLGHSINLQNYSENMSEDDILLVDGFEELESIKSKFSNKVILLSHRPSNEENFNLIHKFNIKHLIGIKSNNLRGEIISVIKKLNGHKGFWGIESHLGDIKQKETLSISESRISSHDVSRLIRKIDYSDYFDSPVDYLDLVANELVSNALYNGPEQKREDYLKYPIDRTSPVSLKGTELVNFTIARDDNAIAICVQDCFGALTSQKVMNNLQRSFQEKTVQQKKGGAGLGLYLIYSHANQLIFNFESGRKTEVIFIIEKNKRYKAYKERITSFHYFDKGDI